MVVSVSDDDLLIGPHAKSVRRMKLAFLISQSAEFVSDLHCCRFLKPIAQIVAPLQTCVHPHGIVQGQRSSVHLSQSRQIGKKLTLIRSHNVGLGLNWRRRIVNVLGSFTLQVSKFQPLKVGHDVIQGVVVVVLNLILL